MKISVREFGEIASVLAPIIGGLARRLDAATGTGTGDGEGVSTRADSLDGLAEAIGARFALVDARIATLVETVDALAATKARKPGRPRKSAPRASKANGANAAPAETAQ